MKYKVQFYSKRGYVKTVVNESITSGLGKQIAEETVKIAQENNSNLLLIDVRKVNIETNVHEIYDLPGRLGEKSNLSRRYMLALVIAKDIDDPEFFETASVDSGCDVRVFDRLKDAEEWLVSN